MPVYRRKAEIVARDIAGERLLVPIRGNLADLQQLFSLNPVAAHIWDALDGEKSLEEIRETLLARFDVPPEEAERDLAEFIAAIDEAGLIEGVG